MKIGINGYEAVVPRFGFDAKTGLPNRVGSGEFCFQLINNLSKIDKKNEYFIFLPKDPTPDLPKKHKNWNYVVFSSRLWTLLGLSRRLMSYKEKIDVFFSPTHYLPFVTRGPSVIAILDVSYLHFPELFRKKDLYQLKFWGKYSMNKAKKIITISRASKNDIIKEYGVNPSKVVVIYPGIKEISNIKYKLSDMDKLKKKYKISGNYILFVGTIQPRKNIARLIEAFSKLETDLDLVIIGKKGWMWEDILKAPQKFGIENRVKFLHEVPDDELPTFYKNAVCFVLPSLYEGFGLPILEAMKFGCPVLASNVSSLPEAGGDAALYCNPENVDDIAKNLESIIQNSELREQLVKKGFEQVKKFSWENAARETLKVLEEIGQKD
ncbi:MAG: glycosyltransferase family 1 protein [Candidatus Pacearchaeota archaeon]